jgi:hypothetical protein
MIPNIMGKFTYPSKYLKFGIHLRAKKIPSGKKPRGTGGLEWVWKVYSIT